MSVEARTIPGLFLGRQQGSSDAPKSEGRAASRQAYSLQYTSLILIVLTFVIGAFVRGPIGKEVEVVVPLPKNAENVKVTTPTGLMEYNKLFDESGSVILPERLDALATFLKSHDINAEIQVFGDQEGPGTIEIALARSVSVSRYLEEKGVPGSALKIYAVNLTGDNQAKVKFYIEGEN